MFDVKGIKFTAKAVFSTWAKTGYLFDLGNYGGWFISEYLLYMKPTLFVKKLENPQEVLDVLSGIQQINYGGYQPFENDNYSEDLEFDYYLSNLESKGLLSKSKDLEIFYFEKVCGKKIEVDEIILNRKQIPYSKFRINELGIENFRNINISQNFKLSPITFFTGKNNSGKSSVLKSFLFLTGLSYNTNKDKFEINPSLKEGLIKQINLDYSSIFNEDSNSKKISISLNLDFKFEKYPSEELIAIFDFDGNDNDSTLELKTFTIDFSNKQDNIEYVLKLKQEDEFKEIQLNKSIFNIDEDRNLTYTFPEEPGTGFNSLFNIFNEQIQIFDLLMIVKEKEIIDLNKNQEVESLLGKIANLIESIHKGRDIVYVPSHRSEIARSFDSNSSYFGSVIEFLFNMRNNTNFIDEMNKWLNYFEISKEYKVERDYSGKYILKLGDQHISDMGYGIMQLFTVISASVLSSFNFKSIVIIEEPESNLHPNLQSKLTVFFYELNKNDGTQFLIETHSEYVIRSSQIVVKTTSSLELFKVYYCSKEILPYPMIYRQDGIFKNKFGDGFFDVSANQLFEIL